MTWVLDLQDVSYKLKGKQNVSNIISLADKIAPKVLS